MSKRSSQIECKKIIAFIMQNVNKVFHIEYFWQKKILQKILVKTALELLLRGSLKYFSSILSCPCSHMAPQIPTNNTAPQLCFDLLLL